MISACSTPAKCRAYLFRNGQLQPLDDSPTDFTEDAEEGLREAGYFFVRRLGASESQAELGFGFAQVFERLNSHLTWVVEVSPAGDLAQMVFADSAMDALELIARVERDLAAQQCGKAVCRMNKKPSQIKAVDVAQLVERLGLSVAKIESKNFRCACVNCPSSDAMGVHRQRGIARCWACGYKASPYRLALRALNDDKTAARALMLDVGEFVAQAKTKSKKKSKGPKAMMATVDAQSITPGKESASEDSITHPGVDQITAVSEVLARVASEKKIADPAWLVRYGAMASADTHGGACLKLPAYSPTASIARCFGFCPTIQHWTKNSQDAEKGHLERRRPAIVVPAATLGMKDWTTPRLPAPAEHWRLCEGVKDASVLAGEFGLLVVGMPGNDCPDIDLAKMFGGCKATLILDADHAGVIGAYRTAERLHAAGIETYVVVPPVDIAPKHGLDCRDILALPTARRCFKMLSKARWLGRMRFSTRSSHRSSRTQMNAPSQSTPGPTNTTLPPITTTLSIWDEAAEPTLQTASDSRLDSKTICGGASCGKSGCGGRCAMGG